MSATVTYRAKCDSYGFRGYFWEKGEETEVAPHELKDPSLAHFARVSDLPVEAPAKQKPKKHTPTGGKQQKQAPTPRRTPPRRTQTGDDDA